MVVGEADLGDAAAGLDEVAGAVSEVGVLDDPAGQGADWPDTEILRDNARRLFGFSA